MTRQEVRERAGNLCEYCGIHEGAFAICPFHIDHIVARQHGGTDDPSNLALACERCNAYKGTNLATLDRKGKMIAVFHPRTDSWEDHFELVDGIIVGKTEKGVATVRLLEMNQLNRVRLRLATQ